MLLNILQCIKIKSPAVHLLLVPFIGHGEKNNSDQKETEMYRAELFGVSFLENISLLEKNEAVILLVWEALQYRSPFEHDRVVLGFP